MAFFGLSKIIDTKHGFQGIQKVCLRAGTQF